MPRITEERKEARRDQILDAARACLQEHGLEALSMETIIARSGLSTGAVYGYFKGKDEIINAAITEGTAELAAKLAPIIGNPEPPAPAELLEQVLRTIVSFGRQTGGIDRLLVALHGWSHSQSDPELKTATGAAYRRLRSAYADTARRWQTAGTIGSDADPDSIAELLTSITLGFTAQRALTGNANPHAHIDALVALTRQTS